MAKKARKKVLALLIAVLTIGQSLSLTSFAQSSNSQSSENSFVSISSSGNTTFFSIEMTEDAQQSEIIEAASTKVVNADGVNPDAAKLTKGYSVNSEKFDLRNVNGKSYITPVRSQSPFGTCWSFATVAALESSVLGSGLNGADGKTADPKTLNLSEKQIAWFSARPLNIPGHSQNGEGQFVEEAQNTPEGLTEFLNRGGNYLFSENALMQGIGPSHESSDPQYEYHGSNSKVVYKWSDGKMRKYTYSDLDTWEISDDLRFRSDYCVQETHDLPCTGSIDDDGYYTYNEQGTKAIKEELLNLRAVQVAFYADTSMPGVNNDAEYLSKNWAHYTYLPLEVNHSVAIVGWDDNYPKENFVNGSVGNVMGDGKTVTIDKQPPANGAWLVRNSWGSAESEFPDKENANWGIVENGVHTGYFWLSYYDKSLARQNPISYVVKESYENVDNTDQYDFMPWADAFSAEFDQEVKMANRFKAEHNELLKQACCYTSEPDVEVTYEIYLLDYTAKTPTDGIKAAERKVRYRYQGFHKEDIKDFDILFDTRGDGSGEIAVASRQKYAIVVTQKNKNGKYLMNYPYSFNNESGMFSFKGIINEGESYVCCDGQWSDYTQSDELRQQAHEQLNADTEDTFSFDNFPIKCFTQTLENDTSIQFEGTNILYYKTKKNNATLRFALHTDPEYDPDFGTDDISWGILPCEGENGEIYIEGKTEDGDPTKFKFTSKETADKTTRLYFTIKGLGTFSVKVQVRKMGFDSIVFPFDGKNAKLTYAYTGKEIKPCIGVNGSDCVEELTENEDYEFTYSNNIKCGLATVTATPKGEKISQNSKATAGFVIVPAKPVITKVKADGMKIKVEIKDQSESDPSGYTVGYKAKDEEEWQWIFYDGVGTSFTVFGVQPGKTYDVVVMGYTEIPEDEELWEGDITNYGEQSDVKTVKIPSEVDPIVRISGDNRYATAAEIAKSTFDKADTVILAYGMNYADALAGVVLAEDLKAPILLTNTDSLPRQTTNAIEKLGAKKVIILGGTGVISEAVEKTLKQQGLNVERVAGRTRFETAVKIAGKVEEYYGEAPEDLFFVNANSFADALSISSAAAVLDAPIIYLSNDGELDKATAKYLESVKGSVKNAYFIGGEGVISDEMMKTAGDALGIEPTRISGKNRYETCIAVNEAFKDELTGCSICVATGADFPDALTGGVYAALNKAPMLLATGTLSKAQTDYLKNINTKQIVVFGGKSVVPDELVDKISKAKA